MKAFTAALLATSAFAEIIEFIYENY